MKTASKQVMILGVIVTFLILMTTMVSAKSSFTASDYKRALAQKRAALEEIGLNAAAEYPLFASKRVLGDCSVNCVNKLNTCCSVYGWCGTGPAYCGPQCAAIGLTSQ